MIQNGDHWAVTCGEHSRLLDICLWPVQQIDLVASPMQEPSVHKRQVKAPGDET